MSQFIEKLADKKTALEGVEGFDAAFKAANAMEKIPLYDGLPALLTACADKQKPVAQAASALVKSMFEDVPAWSGGFLLPLLKVALGASAKPETKQIACELVTKFTEQHPLSVASEIGWLVYPLSILMNDLKAPVKKAANAAMSLVASCSGNKDLEKFAPAIIKGLESDKNVPECVEELAGCIFVQNVEGPAVSILCPVLTLGLKNRNEQVKRRCCVIVDNMCKLIDDPREGAPLLAEVRGLVLKATESIADPDAREMSEKAMASIEKMAGAGTFEEQDFATFAAKSGVKIDALNASQINYCSKVAFQLMKQKQPGAAKEAFAVVGLDASACTEMVKTMMNSNEKEEVEFIDDDADAPDLYKGSFSLAYGTITLLRETKLHLKKHKFYGLLGPTNCGKTTMMRAISQEKVDGFPKRTELVTIFVEHDIHEVEIEPPSKEWPTGKLNIDLTGWEFVMHIVNDYYKKSPAVTEEKVKQTLGETGFKWVEKGINPSAAADMDNPITTYSGGWKVKMQLTCAQLVDADILMIDDPTGHMDVKNVMWVKNWLTNFPGSIIATSANTVFLNEMCTHVVDFHDRKLRQFKATQGEVLTKYVELYPEKASYFELSDKNEKWVFPVPGALEGVKSRGRTIMKMQDVTFKYPSHEKNTVEHVTLTACMASRVAVVGANGAGKSTAIKLLIGELKSESGVIWRHQNMRLAYVAQHAFHHLEKHMDKTPVDYIMWRFAGADDRESLENQNKELNDDDEKKRVQPWWICPKTFDVKKCDMTDTKEGKLSRASAVQPDAILARQKHTKTKKYIYQVKWMHKDTDQASWVEREILLEMGYSKIVFKKDEQEAAASGLLTKQLTQPGVEKALKDFGLDGEAASHSPIQSLSHGQKVKVVICASCWQNPHLIILDEPTNYLDRDGLGALVKGLEDYQGGVVIISHNTEFTDQVCTQQWVMTKDKTSGSGRLTEVGAAVDDAAMEEVKGPDEVYDEAGNKITVKKKMDTKEIKKAIKEIEKKIKDNKKTKTMTEEDEWEIGDKLEELKAMLLA